LKRERYIISCFLFYLLILILGIGHSSLNAQTEGQGQHSIRVEFREVALIDLIGEEYIDLDLSGLDPVFLDTVTEITIPNSRRWINYTTLSDNSVQYRISLQSSSLPEGFDLTVIAQNPLETGGGTKGVSRALSPVVVSEGAEVILIDEITSSYTGVGENNGVAMEFQLKRSDLSKKFSDIEGYRFILRCEITGYQ